MEKRRCDFNWNASYATEVFRIYHDTRWCKPEHRDNELFAMLILEGMQAGLSWNIILNKEENIRKAFDGLDPQIVSGYGEEKLEEWLQNTGIIRSRNKLLSAITNAKAFLQVQKEFGSFDAYIWGFTDGKVIDHHVQTAADIPSQNELSQQISRDLKKRGFKFVGPTIIYSYLQGIGIINDHCEYCEYR